MSERLQMRWRRKQRTCSRWGSVRAALLQPLSTLRHRCSVPALLLVLLPSPSAEAAARRRLLRCFLPRGRWEQSDERRNHRAREAIALNATRGAIPEVVRRRTQPGRCCGLVHCHHASDSAMTIGLSRVRNAAPCDEGLKALAEALPETNIEKLSLDNGNISDEGLDALRAVLEDTSIAKLWINGAQVL